MFAGDIRIYDKINNRWIHDPLSWELGELQLDGIIVCHYVGQKDVYDCKIYEYDIVQSYWQDGSIRSNFYIKYMPKLCKFNLDINLIQSRRLQVIGNVFDNSNYLMDADKEKLEKTLGIKLKGVNIK